MAKRKTRTVGSVAWKRPLDGDNIIKIVAMRDKQALTFGQIGEELGITRAGAYKQYARWRDWARQQPAFKKLKAS